MRRNQVIDSQVKHLVTFIGNLNLLKDAASVSVVKKIDGDDCIGAKLVIGGCEIAIPITINVEESNKYLHELLGAFTDDWIKKAKNKIAELYNL